MNLWGLLLVVKEYGSLNILTFRCSTSITIDLRKSYCKQNVML